MGDFILWAQPWYINLLILVPIALFFVFRKNKLSINKRDLLVTALFGIAFGFVEAAVVIYLRAATGLLPGYMGTLSDVIAQAGSYQPMQAVTTLPQSLLTVELFREAATIVMLATVALLCARRLKEQFALFVWTFAFWDLFYYVWLWATTRWPSSLTTGDVLFLIPVPWVAQVWFPMLVCVLTMLAVVVNRRSDASAS